MSSAPAATDGRGAASLLLRIAVVIHMVGWAYALHARYGSSLGGVALMNHGIEHATIGFHERLWSKVLVALSLLLLLRPMAWPAFIIGGVVALETAAAIRFGGNHFVEISFYTSALRYGLPLALGVLLLNAGRLNASVASWMLRLGLAAVFASHGYAALRGHPGFIDLLIGTTDNLLGLRLSEGIAVAMLRFIGIIDLVAAALALIRQWPALLGWLCFWSLITALSRMTTYGMMAFPEVLMRASHIAAPVAVLMLSPAWSAALNWPAVRLPSPLRATTE